MRRMAVAGALALAGCNGGFAGPNAPGTACPEVSEARFGELIDAGATQGKAIIHASGTVLLETGPGVVQCSSITPKTCRRPNEYVIRYTLADGSRRHVHVPAGSQYRFRVGARPTTCEIVATP